MNLKSPQVSKGATLSAVSTTLEEYDSNGNVCLCHIIYTQCLTAVFNRKPLQAYVRLNYIAVKSSSLGNGIQFVRDVQLRMHTNVL